MELRRLPSRLDRVPVRSIEGVRRFDAQIAGRRQWLRRSGPRRPAGGWVETTSWFSLTSTTGLGRLWVAFPSLRMPTGHGGRVPTDSCHRGSSAESLALLREVRSAGTQFSRAHRRGHSRGQRRGVSAAVDGIIVGAALKRNGSDPEPVDVKRVREYMSARPGRRHYMTIHDTFPGPSMDRGFYQEFVSRARCVEGRFDQPGSKSRTVAARIDRSRRPRAPGDLPRGSTDLGHVLCRNASRSDESVCGTTRRSITRKSTSRPMSRLWGNMPRFRPLMTIVTDTVQEHPHEEPHLVTIASSPPIATRTIGIGRSAATSPMSSSPTTAGRISPRRSQPFGLGPESPPRQPQSVPEDRIRLVDRAWCSWSRAMPSAVTTWSSLPSSTSSSP